MSTTLDDGRVGALAGQLSGLVVSPRDAGYDEARAIHNGLVDRRPALIVRCRTTADVVAALEFARGAGLEVSVRGGGHNVAGRAVTDSGVMISLDDRDRGPYPRRRARLADGQARARGGQSPRRRARDRGRRGARGRRRLAP